VVSRTALVTGATAGIGAAFARRLAADGYGLVLVARDAERLAGTAADLAEQHGVPAVALPADLSTDSGCGLVEDRLRGSGDEIDLLVNNAGMSLNKPLLRSSAEDQTRMLRLNVHAVMRLTLAALPAMTERRHGAVVNVSSVAGFGVPQPGSTYSASKAWVTNFSESVGLSVRPYGVRVMALCPGYTRTEFHQRAGVDMSRTPGWLWLDADTVVAEGMRDLGRGRFVSVPDWKYKLAAFGLRHVPIRLATAVSRDVSKDSRARIDRPKG
jgi:short-subunit dehydrogenase